MKLSFKNADRVRKIFGIITKPLEGLIPRPELVSFWDKFSEKSPDDLVEVNVKLIVDGVELPLREELDYYVAGMDAVVHNEVYALIDKRQAENLDSTYGDRLDLLRSKLEDAVDEINSLIGKSGW